LIAAKSFEVYAALLQVRSWWDPEHTFSGDAHNMSLDARAGGCFCERLADQGSVQHMDRRIRRRGARTTDAGALGPLQTVVASGSMAWKLFPEANGTRLELTYNVGGYRPGGLAELATPVDSVLRAQLLCLKSFVETGKPET
jgi:hypothetical protein